MTQLLGANTDTLDRVAESLDATGRSVQDIRDQAQRAVAELQSGWSGPDLWSLSRQWEQQASPQLASASTSLAACAAQLRAQAQAQRGASSRDGNSMGPLPAWFGWVEPGIALGVGSRPSEASQGAGLDVPFGPPLAMPGAESPPGRGSPADRSTWWKALSPQQQEHIVTDHPGWIGNLDGVPFATRDRANRAMLSVGRADLVDERQRLEADLADNRFGGLFTSDDAALAQVRDRLASLDAIEQTLARPGERQLLVLDLTPERAQAAIARGNVDNADNVAVLVPGLTANVTDSMEGYDNAMDQLQHRTELENRRVTPAEVVTTATVTWIGYQAPQLGWDLIGDTSVADDHAARAGAVQLTSFLQGIGASRDDDAHLSVLGYSYGATTAGIALRQDTGVDDVVFFGSPGIGTNHIEDLSVPQGHAYYIEARWDPVGDLGYFGIDPSHVDGIEHASARESTVVDPATGEMRHFSEVTGHTSYLVDDSTSQYNMSVVVAGLPDRRVLDRGEGFGDVLSWPVPWSYS